MRRVDGAGTHSLEAAAGPRRLGGMLHRVWWLVVVVALVVLLGARFLRYAGGAASRPWLDALMVVDGQAFLWLWAYSRLKLRMIVAVVAVVLLARHRRVLADLVARESTGLRLRPAAVSLLLGLLVWVHYLLDLNPTVAAVCGATLALAWVAEAASGGLRATTRVPTDDWRGVPSRGDADRDHAGSSAGRRASATLRVGAAMVVAAACLAVAGDVMDRAAIAVWLGVLWASHRLLAPRFPARDVALLRAAVVPAMNLLPALLPLVLGVPGATRVGDGLAYSFCELPGRRALYAAVPACDSVRRDYADCRGSRVVEYDAETLAPRAAHDFFSPDFYGRLELLLCLDDEVQVAVQGSVRHGRSLGMSVLRFPADAPERVTPVFLADGYGATMAWDRAHDAVFYSTEFTNRVLRWDRARGTFDDTASRDLVQIGHEPITLDEYTGSYALHTNSVDPTRNRIYLADWMQGRHAYAIDLDTRRLVARYAVGGGGSLGLTVDPERGRLYVSSLWGLDVVDLASGDVVARKRSGLGNRPVLLDAARNRLYLGSTVEGKIRVLDRDTLATLGQIPIGVGSRYPYLADDGRRLFASSVAAHWAVETTTLP